MPIRRPGHPRLAQYVIPGDISLPGRNLDRSGELEKVGRPRQHSAMTFDAKHDLVAALDAERVPYNLGHGDLTFRRNPRGSVHCILLTYNLQ